MLMSDESARADCATAALPSMVTLNAPADMPSGMYGVAGVDDTGASEARRELVRRMTLASRSRLLARRRWNVAARSRMR